MELLLISSIVANIIRSTIVNIKRIVWTTLVNSFHCWLRVVDQSSEIRARRQWLGFGLGFAGAAGGISSGNNERDYACG